MPGLLKSVCVRVLCVYVRYSSKVTSHSLDIFECESGTSRVRVGYESSACRVDLLICIISLYSVKTAA